MMPVKLESYKIVVVGAEEAGKTALLHYVRRLSSAWIFHTNINQICASLFIKEYDPTIEETQETKRSIDGETCHLEFHDTSGNDELKAIREQAIRDGDGYFLVYNVSSELSFRRVRQFYEEICVHSISNDSKSIPGCATTILATSSSQVPPIVVVGNKSDCPTKRQVSITEGKFLAKELGCMFFETSVRDGTGVEVPVSKVVRELRGKAARSCRLDSDPADGDYVNKRGCVLAVVGWARLLLRLWKRTQRNRG